MDTIYLFFEDFIRRPASQDFSGEVVAQELDIEDLLRAVLVDLMFFWDEPADQAVISFNRPFFTGWLCFPPVELIAVLSFCC